MSFLTLTKQAQPATPAANKSTLFVDTVDRRLKQIDDNGVVSVLTNPGMQGLSALYNGGFAVQQRVATASTAIPNISGTTRAGQVADRWAVTAGNITTTSWAQINAGTATEAGLIAKYYGKITQASNAAKFILSQVLANEDMCHLRGFKVRLSVKVKQFVGSNAVYRLGLLALGAAGTADTIPAITSSFNGASSDPTWGANLTLITPDSSPAPENGTVTGGALSITSSSVWVRSSAVFTIPAGCLNLIPVLYRDTVGAVNDAVGIAEFQMTQGPDIVDYIAQSFGYELVRCQRYFSKSFGQGVVPAQTAGLVNVITALVARAGATALAAKIPIRYPQTMFKAPAVTLFNPSAANGQIRRTDGAAAADCSSTAQVSGGDAGVLVQATGDAAGTVGDTCAIHYTADAEFVT